MTLRPSKTFLFEVLSHEIGKVRGGQGLDASAAMMKNRWMFKTDSYLGVDIDEAALKEGLRRAGGDPNVKALTADLTKDLPLPTGTFDVVVTTNTLSNFDATVRPRVVRELVRLTAPTGVLLCEQPRDDDETERILKAAFNDVRPVYFKNALSRGYERLFERNGWLGSHPIAGLPPFLALSWLISRVEFLTCRSPAANRHVLFLCSGKRNATVSK